MVAQTSSGGANRGRTVGTRHSNNGTATAWSVAAAKARLSEVIERARSEGPQVVTRRGRPAAVVVSAEEWERKSRRQGSLAEFFANSPLRNSGLTIERAGDGPREIEL